MELKKIIDKRYYEKHKRDIYLRKIMRRKKLKEEAVNTSGNKCTFCGYNNCLATLEFHHLEIIKKELLLHS